jgi:hypothetical protein
MQNIFFVAWELSRHRGNIFEHRFRCMYSVSHFGNQPVCPCTAFDTDIPLFDWEFSDISGSPFMRIRYGLMSVRDSCDRNVQGFIKDTLKTTHIVRRASPEGLKFNGIYCNIFKPINIAEILPLENYSQHSLINWKYGFWTKVVSTKVCSLATRKKTIAKLHIQVLSIEIQQPTIRIQDELHTIRGWKLISRIQFKNFIFL